MLEVQIDKILNSFSLFKLLLFSKTRAQHAFKAEIKLFKNIFQANFLQFSFYLKKH